MTVQTRATFVVRALDRRIRVVLDDVTLLEPARRVWHLCLDDDDDDDAAPVQGDVHHRGTTQPGTDGRAQSLQILTQSITRAAIEARAGTHLMLHAGALCDQRTGAALAYVAPGGTGKTTVTRRLGAGRGYLSDETVAVASDLSIAAYPKPLSVRRHRPGPKDETAPADLGLERAAVAPWLAGVVALRRDLDPGQQVRVEKVPLLDALVLLAPETSSLARLDRPLRTFADILERAGGLRVVHYAEATDLEPVVREVLGGRR